MTLFWILSALLTAALALVVIFPLLAGRAESSHSRNELNTRLYRQRLHELAQDKDQGLLEDEESARLELQKSLLDDVVQEPVTPSRRASWLWLPAVALILAVAYGGYFQLGAYREVQAWQDVSGRLGELSKRVLVDQDETVTEQELRELTLALRTRLHKEGDDHRGWLLLGRLALELRDGETARDALERAFNMADDKHSVAVPYAEALAMTGETLRAEGMLKQLLKQDPDNLEAWSVYAFMALQQDDFVSAKRRWQQMLSRMTPEHPRYAMVERSIDFVDQRLAQAKTAPVTGPRYQIQVTTSTAVPYHPGAVLFVYAVDAAGGEMPLVARRIENPGFPLTVTLSNADAMVPDNNMSQREAVVLRARIAPSGNVMDKTGAWEGRSAALSTAQDSSVEIMIDTPL